jgi:hypothetical protein
MYKTVFEKVIINAEKSIGCQTLKKLPQQLQSYNDVKYSSITLLIAAGWQLRDQKSSTLEQVTGIIINVLNDWYLKLVIRH